MATLPSLWITNLWTPAHIGTVANEFADDAAEAAQTLLPVPPSVPVTLTTCKRGITVAALERWKQSWKVATPGKGLREIDDSPPSLILHSPYQSSASRADISTLSQLCTDFSQLNAHCFSSRLTPSPACEACGAASETRTHYLPTARHGSISACPCSSHRTAPGSSEPSTSAPS
jgi:hypothetical protein